MFLCREILKIRVLCVSTLQFVCGWVYEHTCVYTDARLLGVCMPCVWVSRQHAGTVGVCFGGECNPSRSCFPDLRWRKTALAVCRFISSTGVQNKEKMIDWLMNNLEAESCGTSRLSARLPRSRSLLKDRVTPKKLAPDCTNACHCSFAELIYGKGRKPKQAGTFGEKRKSSFLCTAHVNFQSIYSSTWLIQHTHSYSNRIGSYGPLRSGFCSTSL